MAPRNASGETRRGRLRAVESLAGWVFADMLLVLFLVGIGTAIPHEPPPPPPPPVEKPKPEIVGMRTTPVKETVEVDADALTVLDPTSQRQACAALKRAFVAQIENQERAAFVLVFGGGSDPSDAALTAERAFPQLRCASSVLFPRGTVGRFYWDGQLPRDQIRVEAFLYTTKKSG